MPYRNPDPGAERDGIETANNTVSYLKKEISRKIDKKYNHRDWTPLTMELKQAAYDEAIRLLSDERLKLKKIRIDNDFRYKSQDETYPELQDDLKRIYPS